MVLYGFAKNEQENLSPDELREYQKTARAYLRLHENELRKVLEEGNYEETVSK